MRSASELADQEPVEEGAASPPSSTKTWEEDETGVKKRVGRLTLLTYPDERLENLLNFYKIEVASKGPTRHLAMVDAVMLKIKGRRSATAIHPSINKVLLKAVKKVEPKKKRGRPAMSRQVKSPAPPRPAQSSPTPSSPVPPLARPSLDKPVLPRKWLKPSSGGGTRRREH